MKGCGGLIFLFEKRCRIMIAFPNRMGRGSGRSSHLLEYGSRFGGGGRLDRTCFMAIIIEIICCLKYIHHGPS